MGQMTAEQLSAQFTGTRGAEPQAEAAPATSSEPVEIGFDDSSPSGEGQAAADSSQESPGEAQVGEDGADGQRIPYQRFKQINDQLKEAKQELTQLRGGQSDQQTQQRIQALEERLAQSQPVKAEPDPFVEKVRGMVGDEEHRDGRDTLMLQMAEELSQLRNQSTETRKMSENAQVERYVTELRGRSDGALKATDVVNAEGARAFLVSKLQQDVNTDLKSAVQEFSDWETKTYGARGQSTETPPGDTESLATAPRVSQSGGSETTASNQTTNKRRPKNFNEMRNYITGSKFSRKRFKK